MYLLVNLIIIFGVCVTTYQIKTYFDSKK